MILIDVGFSQPVMKVLMISMAVASARLPMKDLWQAFNYRQSHTACLSMNSIAVGFSHPVMKDLSMSNGCGFSPASDERSLAGF